MYSMCWRAKLSSYKVSKGIPPIQENQERISWGSKDHKSQDLKSRNEWVKGEESTFQEEGIIPSGPCGERELKAQLWAGAQSPVSHTRDYALQPKSNEKPLKQITQRDTWTGEDCKNRILAAPWRMICEETRAWRDTSEELPQECRQGKC